MVETITPYSLFDGRVRSLNVSLGLNQNPTVVTATVVRDAQTVSITNRQVVDISVGELDFRGVVQSWSEAKTDVAGTGIFQVRITDTKPVLEATQVIIGSSFDTGNTQAYNYGDNIIGVVPQNASQISNGIPVGVIITAVEAATIKYGSQTYTVNFNFTLPTRGSSIEYSLKGRTMSLVELISQIANDHGFNWYVTTSASNVISINFFGRTNITNVTVNQLEAMHSDAVIRKHEGLENRDAIQKAVLSGGYRSYLHQADGSLWEQFWGFDSNGNKRKEPIYSEAVMEQIINNDFTSGDFTEEDAQKILYYANEYWGRKFIGLITPTTTIGSDGKSWVVPTSAAWNESNSVPMDFNHDGRLKFQTDDGRWVTFVTLPIPGKRASSDNVILTYQWDDELFSNPNSYIDEDRNISLKASLEIVDGFSEMEYWLELFIVFVQNMSTFTSVTSALILFYNEYSDISATIRTDFTRFIASISSDIVQIANGTLIYTDAVKDSWSESFSDQYFILTLTTPLRVKKVAHSGDSRTITKTRLSELDNTYLALQDQRQMYGPWSNRSTAIGRAEVIIDSSLTPWTFGYRGITNSTGVGLMDQVARSKIKTVADVTLDAKTAELEVAELPAVNIGDQLQTTGTITSMQVTFSINGVKTTYKSSQYTTELSKYLRQQQDLLDKLRRQAAEFNNTMRPPQDDWTLNGALETLKKQLPEPSISTHTEGNRRALKTLLGRIYARSSDDEPKYHITPMAWVADVFGELTLTLDPSVFGNYLNVVNMGEPQTTAGRLPVGTDVQVQEFSVTDGGVVAYYMDTSASAPQTFNATIINSTSNSQPMYKVTPVVSVIQQIDLIDSELLALNSVLNIGEPANYAGYIAVGTEVAIHWNKNSDGSYTPYMEQQLNLFKPPGD